MNFFEQLDNFFSNPEEQATDFIFREIINLISEKDQILDVLAMIKPLFGGDHPNLANALDKLAYLYKEQGKNSEAEPLAKEALAMKKRLFPGDHPDVANSLNNLAYLYLNQGKYSQAEPLFQEALVMRKCLFPGDHSDVATSLSNLALFYDNQGKYSQAELLFQDAIEMKKRLFPGDHPDVATSLNNLAELYKNQGKYSQAKYLFLEALAMKKRLFPGDHPDVATILNNLGLLYKIQEKYSQAEPLFQEALAMKKRLFKIDHIDVATSLNNLGLLYFIQGKYSQAEPLFQEALAMIKRLFTGDNPHVIRSLNNLASLYSNQGKYSDAEPLYKEVLVMIKSLFTGDHPDAATISNNLASLYAKTNRHQKALEFYKEATEVEHRLMSQEFLGSSENDRMLFLDNIRNTQYLLLSLVYKYFYPLEESPEKSDAIHTALDLVLKRKAISNAADAAFNAAMNSDRYPHLQDSFEKYRSLWKQIVNLQSSLSLPENSSRLEPNKKLLKELYAEVETLQKKLSAEVPEMNLENQLVDRQEIASELPENSTLIEFAYLRAYDFTNNEYQTPRYLAFILPAKQPEKVQMIDLGAAEKIDNLISQVRQTISPFNLENMGPSTKNWKPKISQASNSSNPFIELTTTVFQPLKKYLQGEQLFICPDGKLTLIPFEILPVDGENNQLFIYKYQITYLTAGRDLLRHKNQPKRIASESLVIADPNFDLSVEISPNSLSKEEIPPTPLRKGGLEIPTTIQEKTDLSINLNSLKSEIIQTFGQEDKKPFLPVPMTREIAEAVAAEFQVKPLLQNDALKTHLTNSKCPKKLVLATHGFFLEQKDPPQPPLERGEFDNSLQPVLERGKFMEIGLRFRQIQTEKNPLWRSGLALAGANTWLFGGEVPQEAESGILFALDVAGLDLWANELIILIACETAVGDVKIGEGVKGLRSAFTAAGARLLIMSLWSVPAQVSILLMNRFLTNMQQKKLSSQQALQEAQLYIKTITRTELEALPTGEKILQESRAYWQNKSSELLVQWDVKNYPLQARHFWGAWVCVGREFKS
ncbi:MAG: CHAT domain-containing protein [Okeania sp. SIO3B3]|nr:CHAT domain-containing protein [Okeania sp. SIO3B3]